VLASPSAGNSKGARALNVSGNLLAVADERRAAGALILKGAASAVIDGLNTGTKSSDGKNGKLHFLLVVLDVKSG